MTDYTKLIERHRQKQIEGDALSAGTADALEQAQQRIAELETKIAEWEERNKTGWIQELRDHAKLSIVHKQQAAALALQVETMREALNKTKAQCIDGRMFPAVVDPDSFRHAVTQALSTQPAAEIIAAHDAKVIERCAAVADDWDSDSADPREVGYAIRALIAAPAYTPQAAKVSEKGSEQRYWLCCGSIDPQAHRKGCVEAQRGHPEHCRYGTSTEHSLWQRGEKGSE